MGLDITAYAGLFRIDTSHHNEKQIAMFLEGGHWWQPSAALDWSEKQWPGSAGMIGLAGPLASNAVYGFSQRYTFRAGSYSGYGRYRDFLARIALLGKSADDVWKAGVTEGPFIEQINFADNEGVIGSVVARKLSQDYLDHERRALAEADDCRWYCHAYMNWRRAFEIASDQGAVEFH